MKQFFNIAEFHKSLSKAFPECRCDYCIGRVPGIQKKQLDTPAK